MRVFFLSISSRPSPPPAKKPKKKATTILGCWLPWWFVFVGWFLLLSISGISTFFTLLYGFQYGKEKSIKWVMSLGLSLFESIFILQPLKVGKINPFFFLSQFAWLIIWSVSCMSRSEMMYVFEDTWVSTECYSLFLFLKFLQTCMQHYSFLVRSAFSHRW